MNKTINDFRKMKVDGERITWLTCYDYSLARVINETDLDLILVGDSGGMCLLGFVDTSPVTMRDMICMAGAVRRGAPNKFIVGDMPKGSYESSDELAVSNAMIFVKEAGCDAVKLEGSGRMAHRAKAIVESGIPVIGHIGLTPQSLSMFGNYRVVGREEVESQLLINQFKELESAGVFATLIEAVPESLGSKITELSNNLVFGIGAGKNVDGQLLILHDLLGLFADFRPKFAKCFVPDVLDKFRSEINGISNLVEVGRKDRKDGLYRLVQLAIEKYIEDVRNGIFPNETFSYKG